MSIETALVLGCIGMGATFIYASTTINVDEKDDFQLLEGHILNGIKLLLFLMGILILAITPALMWHATNIAQDVSSCTGAGCDPYTNTKTVINSLQWIGSYIGPILLFLLLLFVVLKTVMGGVKNAIDKVRGRDRRRRGSL